MNRQCRNVLPVCFLAFVYIYDQAFIFFGFCLESTAGCSEWPGPWVSRSERKGLSNGRQGCIPKYINTLDIGTLICFSRNERKGLRNGRQGCLLKYIINIDHWHIDLVSRKRAKVSQRTPRLSAEMLSTLVIGALILL